MTRSEMLAMIGGKITLKPSGDFLDYFSFKLRETESGNLIATQQDRCRVVTRKGLVIIPEGFEHDGASIPRLAQKIAGDPFDFDYLREAACHDLLYRKGLMYDFSRAVSDKIFEDLMWNSGVPKWKIIPFYSAVRIGGGSSYKKREGLTL